MDCLFHVSTMSIKNKIKKDFVLLFANSIN